MDTTSAIVQSRTDPTHGQNRLDTQSFVTRASAVHGNRYDYSLVQYIGSRQPVTILCRKHGEFRQQASEHLSGSGCRRCAGLAPVTFAEFVSRSVAIHGHRYQYDEQSYAGFAKKTRILCDIHGLFTQTAKDHAAGHGCSACAGVKRMSAAEFVARGSEIHGERYDYGHVDAIRNGRTKVEIVCPEHGPFWQRPADHLNQEQGCPACSGHEPVSASEFLERARAVHANRYDYSRLEFHGIKSKGTIVCPNHGVFSQWLDNHQKGSGCPACASEKTSSRGEEELAGWLEAQGVHVVRHDRSILGTMEIDIILPEHRIGIEFNGYYWHSEGRMPNRRMHDVKSWKAEKAGYRLFSVWDFDWEDRREMVQDRLLHMLGMSPKPRVDARSCSIARVSRPEASSFYSKNHVQGPPCASVCSIGLHTASGELVAVMSFTRGGSRRGTRGWELIRYATSCVVRGGASRLFRAFLREHDPETVFSYSDRQHFDGGLYTILGFREDQRLPADYTVFSRQDRALRHKSAWKRKNIPNRLRELGIADVFDPETDPRSERDMQDLAGVYRVMDSGKIRWRWDRPTPTNFPLPPNRIPRPALLGSGCRPDPNLTPRSGRQLPRDQSVQRGNRA